MRTNKSDRPGSVTVLAVGAVVTRLSLSRRVTSRHRPWRTFPSARRASGPASCHTPSTLSCASTAATESSRSTIVVSAASSSTSARPAGSFAADRVGAVDDQLDVQAVVDQHRVVGRFFRPAELRVCQSRGRVARPVCPGAFRPPAAHASSRNALARRDDLCAPLGIVAAGPRLARAARRCRRKHRTGYPSARWRR